jgi:hypothetical protein
MKLQVGVTYEKTLEWPAGTVVTFLVVAECIAKTMRFKKDKPGYKVLILAIDGPNYWDLAPGHIDSYVAGAVLIAKARRVDREVRIPGRA